MKGVTHTASSITVVTGPHNAIIGTGLPKDKDFLLSGIKLWGNLDYQNFA